MHTLTGVLGVGFHLYRRRRRFAPLTPVYYKEKPSARVIPFDKLRDLSYHCASIIPSGHQYVLIPNSTFLIVSAIP